MIIELLLVAAVLAIVYLYRYASANGDHFERLKVPFLVPKLLVGNTWRFVFKQQRPDEFLTEFYTAMPHTK